MNAIFSPCGTYRYSLTRQVGQLGFKVCVIMVNPSTADATTDDATIRKLIGFGKRLQWGEITVVNKFAFRATDVNDLKTTDDPTGPNNYAHVLAAMLQADIIVAAWGSLDKLPMMLRGKWRNIKRIARDINKPLYCFGVCKDGHPKHPVMIAYANEIPKWEPPA